jgi:hypothetical protein
LVPVSMTVPRVKVRRVMVSVLWIVLDLASEQRMLMLEPSLWVLDINRYNPWKM